MFNIWDWATLPQKLPWLTLLVMMTPVILMALRFRIYPTRRVIVPALVLTVMSILAAFNSFAMLLLIATDIAIVIFMIFDVLTLAGALQINVERKMQRAASIGKGHLVTLSLDNLAQRDVRFDLRDDILEDLNAVPPEHTVKLPARKRMEVSHLMFSTRRGAFELQFVYLRVYSYFGYWSRVIRKEVPGTIHVYPDMKQLAEYALLAKTNRLSLIGVRRTRKAGQDNNFERLRDYTMDDNYKHIEWRSTARRQKLTVKQFQTDQSQRLVFLLDCGRMMTNEYQGLSLVDYALNSILMLSYVALHQGDSVGMLPFSDKIHEFVPLRGGPSQMNHLLHAGFNRFPELVQSRFDQAFLHLSNHCRRRSMVVLISNVIDEVSAEQISNYLTNLTGKHLPVLVLLRDHRIFDSADNPDLADDVLYRSAAAAQILTWRHEVLQKLRGQGVLVVDAFPEDLTTPLVNQYLEVKAKHLL